MSKRRGEENFEEKLGERREGSSEDCSTVQRSKEEVNNALTDL